jgi:hypothetical protein
MCEDDNLNYMLFVLKSSCVATRTRGALAPFRLQLYSTYYALTGDSDQF